MLDIRYRCVGDINKECVLILHGWGGNEYTFSMLDSVLSRDYFVLSINLSDITTNYLSKPLSMLDYTNAIIYILHRLNIKTCHIICHSFGCRVALLLNKFYDIHISSMVIIDGAGVKDRSIITRCKIKYYKLLKLMVKHKILSGNVLDKYGSSDYKSLDDISKKTFQNIVNYDLKKYIKYIDCPCTIIWGKYDTDTKYIVAKYMRRIIPNSRLITYNGGHFSYVEYPINFVFDIKNHFGIR